jgi:hypothetical protein
MQYMWLGSWSRTDILLLLDQYTFSDAELLCKRQFYSNPLYDHNTLIRDLMKLSWASSRVRWLIGE